jgi:DNA-binding Lrp family transcriptional regulator
MACWVAPPDKVEVIGRRLAALPEVTHCYERRVNARWQYNLFAMIHGHTIEDCQGLARDVSRETDLTDYVLLFSTKEFKKERIKYLV